MKNQILPDLVKLKEQIKSLKKQKEERMVQVTSIKERNKLMREIQELETALKVPSKLKSFARNFSRGLGISGRTLWRGIQSTSKNLDRNAPEFRELSKGMAKRPIRPTSPMMEMYAPAPAPQPYKRVPIRKMKTRKIKKGKKKIVRKTQKRKKPMKKGYDPQMWDFP